jgi:hypothetical protein
MVQAGKQKQCVFAAAVDRGSAIKSVACKPGGIIEKEGR